MKLLGSGFTVPIMPCIGMDNEYEQNKLHLACVMLAIHLK